MESEILDVAQTALEQSGASGYMCVDKDGLCLAAKGQVSQTMSGVIHQIAALASRIEEPNRKVDGEKETKESPVIRVDLERTRMLIRSVDGFTTALISPQK